MRRTPSSFEMDLRVLATKRRWDSDSITQGPAMSARGRELPRLKVPTETCFIAGSNRSRGVGQGSADKIPEQRVRAQRAGAEFWMELHGHKPGVVFELHNFGQFFGSIFARDGEPHRLNLFAETVVELIAVAVAFMDERA